MNLERRVAKLEAARLPRRTHMVWTEPDGDGRAEIASRIAAGTASQDDDFIVVRWMAQGEDDELAKQRKAKNVLERNRAANIGA